MEKATGELLGMIVAVVCIAILVAFFYFAVWPIIEQNFVSQTACEKATCETSPDANGLVNCVLDGTVFQCRFKG